MLALKAKLLLPVLAVIALMLVLFFAPACEGGSEVAHATPDGSDTVQTAQVGTTTPLPVACPFSPGWNLTVLNGSPADLPPCASVVWRWEGHDERWYFWGRDNPTVFNDLSEFSIEKGYWVWAQ